MQLHPQSPWLDPSERKELVAGLLTHGLIKFSNGRDLPLKSGGKTDVYINLRDARNCPAAIALIAQAFENPVRRLNPDRFIEVPDAVSCFAGPLSLATGIPFVTIRERPKEGRVAKATSIGSAPFGSSAVILDDVVTDGESKIVPYREACAMGFNVENLVVLVDRQQGWKKKFAEHGIDLNVWPGMTLHDVRKLLVTDFGIMQRCNPEIEEKNCIIVALDGKSWDETLTIIDSLRPSGCILKVNDLVFDMGIAMGAHGFVCSPEEAKELKSAYPDKLIVTPGIRSEATPKDDQARIATPRGAKDNGSDYLVMGRQILGAKDPVVEVRRVTTEELAIA